MSWQGYVDTQLVGTGRVSQAAIYGLNGGLWAASPGFSLRSEEINEIIAGFDHPDTLLAKGVHINGEKYFVIRSDDKAIYIKKGTEGACIAKTKQAILIGAYDERMQPGPCNVVVESLADYLIGVGY